MSAEEQDITTDETQAPEAPAEGTAVEPAVKDTPADEPVAEDAAAGAPVAEEPPVKEPVADEPVGEDAAAEEPIAEEAQADEPVVEEAVDEETATVAEAFGPVRVARVYVCERGHRTTTLWGEPDNCQARPTRSGPECGLELYHITELPEQVQKALNPLKASKKASKKK